MDKRKVVVIGDGLVGSTISYTLVMSNIVNEIAIIDINEDKVIGDVLDMNHGLSFVSQKKIKKGTYEDIRDAHVIVITAGVAQKVGETRIDLLRRNIKVFDNIIENIKPNLNDHSVVLVVTNPVDILSYHTYLKLGIPHNRVIGSGTVLDTSRLKSLIASYVNVDTNNIHAYVIGEHGDSEVSAFSISTIAGLPIHKYLKEYVPFAVNLEEIETKVKQAAYEIISKKGSTYYAIGLSTLRIIEAILNDHKSVLTISTYIKDEYKGKIKDVYLSLPTILGSKGSQDIIRLDYSYDEVLKLIDSANTLKKMYEECIDC